MGSEERAVSAAASGRTALVTGANRGLGPTGGFFRDGRPITW